MSITCLWSGLPACVQLPHAAEHLRLCQIMMCNNTVYVQRDATTLEVTELPIRKWTQDYKEFLETLIKPEDKNAPALLEVISCDFSGSLVVYPLIPLGNHCLQLV